MKEINNTNTADVDNEAALAAIIGKNPAIEDEDFELLADTMTKAAEGGKTAGGFMNAIGSIPEKFSSVFSSMFSSATGQAMLTMNVSVSKEVLYHQVGLRLQELLWAYIKKHTKELAKHNKVIHYAFHTPVGRAACTVFLCSLGTAGAIHAAQYAEARGHSKQAMAFYGAARVLSYSAGTGILEALSIPSLLQGLADKIVGVAEEEGLDLEKMTEDMKKVA